MTTLKIDADRCVGHGQCYTVAPDLIEDDDRGIAHVRGDGKVPPDRLNAVERAKKLCPEKAVVFADDDGAARRLNA
jgi:ferredoxin